MLESGKLLCCFTDILGKSEHPHGGHDFIPTLRLSPRNIWGTLWTMQEPLRRPKGDRELHHFPKLWPYSRPATGLKGKKEGDAEFEAFFPLLGEEQPVFGECFNSSASAPPGHQVGRREGISEATPRPNFQTIKAQGPP